MHVVVPDVFDDPVAVGFFGAFAEVAEADCVVQLFQQAGLTRRVCGAIFHDVPSIGFRSPRTGNYRKIGA